MGEIGNVNGENRNGGNGNRNVENLKEEQGNVGLWDCVNMGSVNGEWEKM